MNWLYVTTAHHQHAQNIAQSLHEQRVLGRWHAGFVLPQKTGDVTDGVPGWFGRLLQRRVIRTIPFSIVHPFPMWEIVRAVAHHLRLGASVEDLLWEHGEFALDRKAANLIQDGFDGIIGFEHGCLNSLRAARKHGKRAVVVFASVHHSMRERWVDPEYARHSEWADSSEMKLLRRAAERDRRRDEEAHVADQIFANSEFTKRSLVEGGIGREKISAIPLGLPPPEPRSSERPLVPSRELRVLYVGAVALHKGFHYLQQAFLNLSPAQARLDVFGAIRVNPSALARRENVHFHGPVPPDRLVRAYAGSDVLVFPTLCDGFGMVVGEALAHGVPVICSENAGAVDFIEDGVNGFRVPAADSRTIRECLVRCLDDRAALRAMRTAALETAAKWSWSDFRRTFFEALCLGNTAQAGIEK